ncbi:hypothetical protein [Aureispira anguillae]|uniref:Uncharacterized protein n=1 Tax=Aureispira anguillae TaxID=2864201 RepID=A0A916DUK1_9BACT|nr:hypothetical protein [Aureispira anguillae]BDS12311.1 hypothetical protein AsAng_0030320 [Aureispira anguillae]
MITEQILQFAKDQLEKGTTPQDCIIKLKEEGASQRDTVAALTKVYKMSLGEADQLVLFSECWKENLENTIAVRNVFWDVVENYSEEDEI